MYSESIGVETRDLRSVGHHAILVRDGSVEDASGPATELLGEDLIGLGLLEVVAPEYRAEALERLHSCEIGPPMRMGFMADESVLMAEVSWVPLEEGRVLLTWRDVTRSEQVRTWFEAITDNSTDLIGITDTSGELLYMNEALMRLRGDSSRDGLPDGRNAIDHAAPGQSEIVEQLLDEVARTGSWRGQVMFQGTEGIVPVDAVIERSEVGGRTVYSLIGRDMSAEIQLRAELMSAIDERDRFVAHVAHEIKNPLSAVEGMALVLRDETEISPSQREMLELMISGAADVTHVVEDLVGMASGFSTTLRIESGVVDLGALARNVLDTMEAAHGVEVTLTGSAACVGDELRIRQVLRNLLINAIRYGGPDIAVDIHRLDARVHVVVSDDGDGVPDDSTEAIFASFSSAHDTVEGSMGVGLAVSRQLTIGMGGSLSYQRRAGRTLFILDLAAA